MLNMCGSLTTETKSKTKTKLEIKLNISQNPWGFLSGSAGKESTCIVGDLGLIPGLGKSPGEGNGNPLQYSCLEKSMDRGDWQGTVPGVAKEPDTTQ